MNNPEPDQKDIDFVIAIFSKGEFQKALDEAYKQYPNRREPPLALIRKIDRIRDLMEQ